MDISILLFAAAATLFRFAYAIIQSPISPWLMGTAVPLVLAALIVFIFYFRE